MPADPILALITPLTQGGEPTHPIEPSPPGVWPPPGHPGHLPAPPVGLWPRPGRPGHLPAPPTGLWPPAGSPEHPIVIPEPPDPDPSHPIAPPPGTVWPPLNLPDVSGKALLLVWVPGMGFHWVVIDTTLTPEHPIAPGGPEGPQPKTK